MRFIHVAIALGVYALVCISACDLIVPPDPPLEPTVLHPDDYAWNELDIVQAYEYIDVARIDCPKIESTLVKSGKCKPIKLAIGGAIECPLSFPGKKLQVACLNDETPVSAVYAQLEFDVMAKALNFKPLLGACDLQYAGPSAGEPSRYTTDFGYKSCLFTQKAPYSAIRGETSSLRPTGLYLDLSLNAASVDALGALSSDVIFDAPAALVMDARFLNDEQRIQALQDVNLIFSFYRSFATQSTVTGTLE